MRQAGVLVLLVLAAIGSCSRKEQDAKHDEAKQQNRIQPIQTPAKIQTEIEITWKKFATAILNHDVETLKQMSLPRIQLAIGTTDGNEYDRSVSIDYFLKNIFYHVFDKDTKQKLLDSSKLHFSQNDAKNIGGAYWNGLIPKNSKIIEEVLLTVYISPNYPKEELATQFVFDFAPTKNGLKFVEVVSIP